MNYFRNLLLVINDEGEKESILNTIPHWNYCNNMDNFREFDFCLLNKEENIVVSFRKINDYTYMSVNVLPLETNEINIGEPQEKDIHDDILFKLCMSIKKKFVNWEVLCGIIPCESDEI